MTTNPRKSRELRECAATFSIGQLQRPAVKLDRSQMAARKAVPTALTRVAQTEGKRVGATPQGDVNEKNLEWGNHHVE